MKGKLAMRVKKGALVPADGHSEQALRDMMLSLNDVVFATISKPRNPAFNRLVHAFGKLLAANVEAFHGMDPHSVLKRLQIEGNIACKELGVQVPGIGMMLYRIPQSMSFASMDEAKFRKVYLRFCQFVAERYWQELDPEQIAEMAELMADE